MKDADLEIFSNGWLVEIRCDPGADVKPPAETIPRLLSMQQSLAEASAFVASLIDLEYQRQEAR